MCRLILCGLLLCQPATAWALRPTEAKESAPVAAHVAHTLAGLEEDSDQAGRATRRDWLLARLQRVFDATRRGPEAAAEIPGAVVISRRDAIQLITGAATALGINSSMLSLPAGAVVVPPDTAQDLWLTWLGDKEHWELLRSVHDSYGEIRQQLWAARRDFSAVSNLRRNLSTGEADNVAYAILHIATWLQRIATREPQFRFPSSDMLRPLVGLFGNPTEYGPGYVGPDYAEFSRHLMLHPTIKTSYLYQRLHDSVANDPNTRRSCVKIKNGQLQPYSPEEFERHVEGQVAYLFWRNFSGVAAVSPKFPHLIQQISAIDQPATQCAAMVLRALWEDGAAAFAHEPVKTWVELVGQEWIARVGGAVRTEEYRRAVEAKRAARRAHEDAMLRSTDQQGPRPSEPHALLPLPKPVGEEGFRLVPTSTPSLIPVGFYLEGPGLPYATLFARAIALEHKVPFTGIATQQQIDTLAMALSPTADDILHARLVPTDTLGQAEARQQALARLRQDFTAAGPVIVTIDHLALDHLTQQLLYYLQLVGLRCESLDDVDRAEALLYAA